jgi:uncharacterized protein (DUF924 family)
MTDTAPADARWTDAVLDFWFEETKPELWFAKNAQLDERIRGRFLQTYEQVRNGVPDSASARASLAAVIVLDQFPRNLFRDSPQAFATDAQALSIAQRIIASGLDKQLPESQRAFLYMPFQHSEDRAVQARSIELFASLADEEKLSYAKRHKDVVDRFGRFPHRNVVLGRQSSETEREFLKTSPGF